LFGSAFKQRNIAFYDENNIFLIAVRKLKAGKEIFCAYKNAEKNGKVSKD